MIPKERAFTVVFWLAVLTCVALMGVNALTRIRDFTPDSMSYVDVARNLVAGRGLSQSALGFGRLRFSPDDPIPAPFTAHAPGFSIAIALAASTGISFTDAALALPVVFLALSLWIAFLLAKACWNDAIAWVAVALLLHYYPLRHVTAVAWSETMAICFALVALWLLARREREGAGFRHVWLIGVFSGLAFAARYPMAPLLLVAALAFLRRTSLTHLARDGAALAFGFLCSGGLVVLRNLRLTGTLMGAASNPYYTPLVDNLTNTMWALSAYYRFFYLDMPPQTLELWLLVGSLAAIVGILAIQRRLTTVVREVFLERGPRWVLLWSLVYLAFLNVARSITWFDGITHRLTVPAGVGLAILFAALGLKTIGANRRTAALLAMGLILAAVYREGRFLYEKPAVPRGVPPIPRLLWVQEHTTERDLIVGDYTMDLPFLFWPRNAIVFEHYPYTTKLQSENLSAYLQRHCGDFDRAFLVVRDWYGKDQMAWRRAFGPFVAAVITGDPAWYPEYSLIAKLEDSYVFAIRKPRCGATGD